METVGERLVYDLRCWDGVGFWGRDVEGKILGSRAIRYSFFEVICVRFSSHSAFVYGIAWALSKPYKV